MKNKTALNHHTVHCAGGGEKKEEEEEEEEEEEKKKHELWIEENLKLKSFVRYKWTWNTAISLI